MGNRNQHKNKADSIGHFVDGLDENQFPEWAAIGLFYKALHLVEMMLAAKGRHTTSHNERNQVLKTEFPEILRPYKPVYNYSLLCRYHFQPVTSTDVEAIRTLLESIAKYVQLEIDEGGSLSQDIAPTS